MIYLDHNASSLPSETHLTQLFETLKTHRPANPSSQHTLGRTASVFLTEARKNLAKTLGVEAKEVIFTSGGTEANSLGTRGVLEKNFETISNSDTVSIVTTSIEHPCILKTFEMLKNKYSKQIELILIHPNTEGYITLSDIIKSIKSNTILVSIMAANNEIGTIQPTKEFGDFLHYKRWNVVPENLDSSIENFKENVFDLEKYLDDDVSKETLQNLHFHVDAVQIFGKIPSSKWVSSGYDSFALSGHKVGALQGIGALVIRRGRTYVPSQFGGSQEKNRRAGTENLPGIISFGMVSKDIQHEDYWSKIDKIAYLRNKIYDVLSEQKIIQLNSQKENSLPNTIHFSFLPNTKRAEDVILKLDLEKICIGSGAACSSGVPLPSHVLLAMGKTKELAQNTIRVSLGIENTLEDIEIFLHFFSAIV